MKVLCTSVASTYRDFELPSGYAMGVRGRRAFLEMAYVNLAIQYMEACGVRARCSHPLVSTTEDQLYLIAAALWFLGIAIISSS